MVKESLVFIFFFFFTHIYIYTHTLDIVVSNQTLYVVDGLDWLYTVGLALSSKKPTNPLTRWITIISQFYFIYTHRHVCQHSSIAKPSHCMLQIPTICLCTITSCTWSALWSATTSFTSLKSPHTEKKQNAFKEVKDMVAGSRISSSLNIYIYDTLKQMVKTAPKDGF